MHKKKETQTITITSSKPKKAEKQKEASKSHPETRKAEMHLAPHSLSPLSFNLLSDSIPSGVWLTGAPLLWDSGITGKNVVIGVIDSGIDSSHPDLVNTVISSKDYTQDGASPSDYHPHGTHVAGTIAAHGALRGVAPDAKIRDYRVLDTNGSGTSRAVTSAISQAVADGCSILNLSLGGPTSENSMHDAIKKAVKKGVLVCVAVGNEQEEGTGPHVSYPASYPEVVGVGAIDFNTTTGKVTGTRFSNQNKEVDVAADGFEVISTVPGGGYEVYSGTSMACPHVVGFSALLLEKYRRLTRGEKAHVDESQLWGMLRTSTVDVLDVGMDRATGAGMVTAYPALPVRRGREWMIPGMEKGAPR